jgi:hypothetical protein
MNALPDPAYWEGVVDDFHVNAQDTEADQSPVEPETVKLDSR